MSNQLYVGAVAVVLSHISPTIPIGTLVQVQPTLGSDHTVYPLDAPEVYVYSAAGDYDKVPASHLMPLILRESADASDRRQMGDMFFTTHPDVCHCSWCVARRTKPLTQTDIYESTQALKDLTEKIERQLTQWSAGSPSATTEHGQQQQRMHRSVMLYMNRTMRAAREYVDHARRAVSALRGEM